ncbi:MAG: DUF1924 domain-containing protein [Gammaproteobacteria bacterium]|nr:DUF1924 domain-containing protein [Gammaproteobacteria bacterium]
MNTKSLFLLVLIFPAMAWAGGAEELLSQYRQQGAGAFSLERGQALWQREVVHAKGRSPRRCQSCHSRDRNQAGKHLRTGKAIAPMSRAVRADAFSDVRHMKKWFLRNCKWTYGRRCTAQEKGDLLTYLLSGVK